VNLYTLIIQEIRKETNDAITLCFKLPKLRKIQYQAGQFITLIVSINGRKYTRSYSFSSAPSVDSYLEVTVKRVPGGIVSNYINDEIKVGDLLEVSEPMGCFTYDSIKPVQSIYLWGVGSGITPLFSIIKEVLHTQSKLDVFLIYGNKNYESTIFKNQLSLLQKNNSPNLSIINFYSQIDSLEQDNSSRRGRITSDFVVHLLKQNKNVKESVHYICGPKSLKDVIKYTLLEFDIPSPSIFTEEFQLVIDSKEMEGVKDSNVNVLFQGIHYQIFVPRGKSVLATALDHDLNLPFSCQTGNCDTCKAKLKKGELKMLGIITERTDLAEDEFLLCCSYPLSNAVNIELI
jgi:ring-1,2-phenylacetyl-CoA epoxidase subunit PaaE